jgi:tetratricopeptide (TPR) repeat protein
LLALLAWLALALPPLVAHASFADHDDPALRELWAEGLEFERREELAESTRRYEAIAEAVPDSAFIRWRIARNYWRQGERLPMDDKRGRLATFGAAKEWADRSLALDQECGECVLWKMAAMGRLATTGGVIRAASSASRIARLIERGIALRPTHADNERNVTLANLYYAGSAFYRVVPDWIWLRWVIGVRGDNHRALDYIRKAIEICDVRVDYQVELGAVLLCIGTDEDDEARIEEGRAVLRRAMQIEEFQSTDYFDREHARIMIEEPERACGYSRDSWIDLSRAARR